MSYEKVKGITLKDNKVFINSADSSIRPLYFTRWECKPLSKIFAEQGREAVLAAIGKDIWDGNFQLYKGSRLCNLFINARKAIPYYLNFSNYESKAAGRFLAEMVLKLEENPKADLSFVVSKMQSLMNNREYILNGAKETGGNYFNCASIEIQKDRDFALEVLRAGGRYAWFTYPYYYIGDKEFAKEALKYNGCFYRNLQASILEDKDIIRLAYAEGLEGRDYHEHLPDLIPTSLRKDKEFMKEILNLCPSLHLDRTPELLQDKDFALEYVKVCKWMPSQVTNVPKEFLATQEFKDVLMERFGDTELYSVLKDNYIKMGLVPPEPAHKSLDEQIVSAEAKKETVKDMGQSIQNLHAGKNAFAASERG